jgi:hypothetical protein
MPSCREITPGQGPLTVAQFSLASLVICSQFGPVGEHVDLPAVPLDDPQWVALPGAQRRLTRAAVLCGESLRSDGRVRSVEGAPSGSACGGG